MCYENQTNAYETSQINVNLLLSDTVYKNFFTVFTGMKPM